MVTDLRQVLHHLDEIGVRWRNTRFHRYMDALARPANSQPEDSPRSEDELQLWDEAFSQSVQLLEAVSLSSSVDSNILKKKLSDVFDGTDLPPVGNQDDQPRNVLFELMAGALLTSYGFNVRLTAKEEDLTVTHPAIGESFVVECKRPASNLVAAMDRNLRRVTKQLELRRRTRPSHFGMMIIGMDRVYNAARKRVVAPPADSLAEMIQKALTQGVVEVQVRVARQRAASKFKIGMLAFVGLGYASEERALYSLRSMRVFFSSVNPDLVRRLETVFETK